MKLLKLSLTNFKGIKSFTFCPEGANASIYGTNGTGKTTVADAISWLLFDKPSTEEKGFSPKPKNASGEDIHYLDTIVEGTFRLSSGAQLTLTKTFKEVWRKKQGSTEATFTGHTIEYAIDEVPNTKRAFDERVDMICPANLAPVIMKPVYFGDILPWQERRSMLLSVCGDISAEDVLQSSPELKSLRDLLKKPGDGEELYNVEEYREIAKAKMKKLNEELKLLPARIDEVQRSLKRSNCAKTEPELQEALSTYQKELAQAQAELAELHNSNRTQEELRRVKRELEDARSQHNLNERMKNEELNLRIRRLRDEIEGVNSRSIRIQNGLLPDAIADLKAMQDRRRILSEHYRAVQQETFSGDETCPTCGQALSASMIQAAVEKFNLQKSKKLEEMAETSKKQCSKEKIREQEKKTEQLRAQLTVLQEESQRLGVQLKIMQEKILPEISFEETEIFQSLREKYNNLLLNQPTALEDKAKLRIQKAETNVTDVMAEISSLKAEQKLKQRIEELREDVERCTKEYDQYAYGVSLCELFIKTKVSMLDEQINSRFKTVRFQLFEEQINGGMKECCKVLVPGAGSLVRYESANNAARINAGLEIIDVLSEHHGISLPVFVDNAESVVSLVDISSQVIRLVVSEKDQQLRVIIN